MAALLLAAVGGTWWETSLGVFLIKCLFSENGHWSQLSESLLASRKQKVVWRDVDEEDEGWGWQEE